MKSINIGLNKMELVNGFNTAVNTLSFDVDLIQERYTVNAKSMNALTSLDLSKPIECVLQTSDEEKIASALETLQDYIV